MNSPKWQKPKMIDRDTSFHADVCFRKLALKIPRDVSGKSILKELKETRRRVGYLSGKLLDMYAGKRA